MSTTSTPTRPFAVVTGASSGIGYELAKQFAQHGYDLLVVAEDDGIHTAAQQLAAEGTNARPLQADLATYDGVEQLCRMLKSTGRPLDAIAINAGVGVHGEFTDRELEEHLNLINLNVVSPVHLTHRITGRYAGAAAGAHSLYVVDRGDDAGAVRIDLQRVEGVSEVVRRVDP